MARKKSSTLTDGELRIMDVLWRRGEASVKEVTEDLGQTDDDKAPAYNTVLTMLRILAEKGYADHRKEGRAFVYTPKIGREQARKSVVNYLLDRFFNNSPELLVQNLLSNEDLDDRELARLKQQIAEHGEEA